MTSVSANGRARKRTEEGRANLEGGRWLRHDLELERSDGKCGSVKVRRQEFLGQAGRQNGAVAIRSWRFAQPIELKYLRGFRRPRPECEPVEIDANSIAAANDAAIERFIGLKGGRSPERHAQNGSTGWSNPAGDPMSGGDQSASLHLALSAIDSAAGSSLHLAA